MRRCFTLKEFVRLAEGGGAEGGGVGADGGGGFEALVAAAATRRGAAAPVLSAEDDIPDPWGRTREELYACALEIDRALSGLVRLWGRVIRRDVSC
ncbi:hypothetical protein ACF09Y_34005 [Streptomyces massasporeus]|uniref:hypothetical protein n=1 Tax=Streptomyces massasporeus TaxID=67324 RepID=UPI0037020101